MAGVVLETLSGRKLSVLGVSLLLVLIVFFVIGGKVAPNPSNVITVLGTKCIDKSYDKTASPKFFIPRGIGSCDSIAELDEARVFEENIQADDIVFSFWIPHVRGVQLKMYRWMQTILSVLQVDIEYSADNPMGENAVMRLDAKIGYRETTDNATDWKELASSIEDRRLECSIEENKKDDGNHYSCDLLHFFELGSCHHDFYLVNIRLPTGINENMNIGRLKDMTVVAIHQNGGFTRVWFSLKTVMFPTILLVLIWFWRRIQLMSRPANLLERTLFSLGIALCFMNLPIEWLTLWLDMPFMLLISDFRQGVFYASLMCFWIIFAGEHMMDQVERNRVTLYWKHLSAIIFGSVCLCAFEICQRGVQLSNPFYSIWVTEVGTNLALAFIIMAGIAASVYFIFLCYMVFRVFRNIGSKSTALPNMSSVRRKYYQGLIYRFKFLMLATLLCAALTVIFFIISQVNESVWRWGDEDNDWARPSLEYTSAFFTGVYGMWNVYVFGLLSLYAPSHKKIQESDDTATGSQEEEVQLTQIPSETSTIPPTQEGSALQAFVSKAAED